MSRTTFENERPSHKQVHLTDFDNGHFNNVDYDVPRSPHINNVDYDLS